VVVVWLLSTGLVAWLVDRQIQHNFDVELVESTHRQLYPALLDLQQRHRPDATGAYRAADARGEALEPQVMGAIPGDSQTEPLLMQLRDAQGGVLLRTPASPAAAFAVPLQAGFFNTPEYRVFSLHDATHNVWLQLADPLEERAQARWRTASGLIAVLLLMLPVLLWLIHWIARRELHSLRWLQAQIQQRSGDHLQPLALTDLPRELHQVGQDVNQLLHRLHLALDVERALAANAAHELRTPLASVRLRLHTAIEQAEASGSGHIALAQIQPILQALHTLSHRTERLLQLSRAEAAAQQRTAVDLGQLCTTLAQEFWQQPQAQKRLDWEPPDAAVTVLGDIDTLAIALRNLIDNALTYSSGPVELAVQAQPPAIIVRDSGPGIAAADLPTVQQRHVRADAARLGYGLGLSIVGSIARQHGAHFTLTSPVPGRSNGLQAMLVFPGGVSP
jgi:two-component system OmpR family sensor kinase